MENITEAIRICRKNSRESLSSAAALAILNMAVLKKDADNTFRHLKSK